jgi:predicted nucleic acid-binding protein
MNKLFIDSNIWVYAFDEDGAPRGIAALKFIELFRQLYLHYSPVKRA